MNRRGEYGGQVFGPMRRVLSGQAAPVPGDRRVLVNLGMIGIGVGVGIAAWPAHNKPLGALALGASGGMISAGVVELLFGRR